MDTLAAIAPFVIAGSIVPTWTVIVIGLLGTERPIANATAFIAGNAVYRMGFGALLIIFASSLPQSTSLRLDSGGFDPLVPLGVGLVMLTLGGIVWARPPAPEGRTLIDRAQRVHPWVSFVTGIAVVASPGVQYAYFIGGMAAVAETISGTGARLAALLGFALALQWMLVMPILVYLVFRTQAERVLSRISVWLKTNGQRLGGGILIAAGLYLTAFGAIDLIG